MALNLMPGYGLMPLQYHLHLHKHPAKGFFEAGSFFMKVDLPEPLGLQNA